MHSFKFYLFLHEISKYIFYTQINDFDWGNHYYYSQNDYDMGIPDFRLQLSDTRFNRMDMRSNNRL